MDRQSTLCKGKTAEEEKVRSIPLDEANVKTELIHQGNGHADESEGENGHSNAKKPAKHGDLVPLLDDQEKNDSNDVVVEGVFEGSDDCNGVKTNSNNDSVSHFSEVVVGDINGDDDDCDGGIAHAFDGGNDDKDGGYDDVGSDDDGDGSGDDNSDVVVGLDSDDGSGNDSGDDDVVNVDDDVRVDDNGAEDGDEDVGSYYNDGSGDDKGDEDVVNVNDDVRVDDNGAEDGDHNVGSYYDECSGDNKGDDDVVNVDDEGSGDEDVGSYCKDGSGDDNGDVVNVDDDVRVDDNGAEDGDEDVGSYYNDGSGDNKGDEDVVNVNDDVRVDDNGAEDGDDNVGSYYDECCGDDNVVNVDDESSGDDDVGSYCEDGSNDENDENGGDVYDYKDDESHSLQEYIGDRTDGSDFTKNEHEKLYKTHINTAGRSCSTSRQLVENREQHSKGFFVEDDGNSKIGRSFPKPEDAFENEEKRSDQVFKNRLDQNRDEMKCLHVEKQRLRFQERRNVDLKMAARKVVEVPCPSARNNLVCPGRQGNSHRLQQDRDRYIQEGFGSRGESFSGERHEDENIPSKVQFTHKQAEYGGTFSERDLSRARVPTLSPRDLYECENDGQQVCYDSVTPEQDVDKPETMELLVTAMNEKTTEDGLLNFIEAMSGEEVKEIVMLRKGRALVTMAAGMTRSLFFPPSGKKRDPGYEVVSSFTYSTDFGKMKEKCEKRGLDKAKVKITLAPVCRSIWVSGLTPNTTRDTLELYFESRRSGGGPVETVEFLAGSGEAVVVFENAKDMERVVARQEHQLHVLDNSVLNLEYLQRTYEDASEKSKDPVPPSPPPSRTTMKRVIPQSKPQTAQRLHLVVDSDVMQFVETSSHKVELERLLTERVCELSWKPSNSVAILLYNGQERGDCWQTECIDILQSFLGRFDKCNVVVQEEFWNAVVDKLPYIRACLGDDPPLVQSVEDSLVLRIVALKSDIERYEEKLRCQLEEICILERRKTYCKEEISGVDTERISLLRKIDFENKFQQGFSELQVVWNDDGIYLEGPEEQVTNAAKTFWEQIDKMRVVPLRLSEGLLKVLYTDEALEEIKTELQTNQVHAVFVHEHICAKVLGTTATHAGEGVRLINGLTAEMKIHVEEIDIPLTTTSQWHQLCSEIQEEKKVFIHRNDSGDALVTGLRKEVVRSFDTLNSFLSENAIKKEEFLCTSSDTRQYLRQHRQRDLKLIEEKLEKYDVKIQDGQDVQTFCIFGRGEGLSQARVMLHAIVSRVVTKQFELKLPGIRKFFVSGKGDRLVKSVERGQECFIRVEKKFTQKRNVLASNEAALETEDSDSSSSGDEQILSEVKHSFVPSIGSSAFLTAQGHSISWKSGDIAREQADTLVCSEGACANAVKQSAGSAMGQSAVTPRIGDIAVYPGYNLSCQHVIFTRCCDWSGGSGEQTLRTIVKKSLRKADELGGSSIAFPVIGAGNLNFPPNEASRIMLDETVIFCQNNPHSSVKDIRFVLFHQDQRLISDFQREMNTAQARHGINDQTAQHGINDQAVAGATRWGNVEVVTGDLTKERTDAIVNINSKEMNLYTAGALSKAVARASGPQVDRECKALGQQRGGSAVMTSGGKLSVRHIIHLIPDSSNKQHLQICLEECLRLADRKGLRSVSIPAIGTGAYHLSAVESAQLTFQALSNISGSCANVRHVRIVVFQSDMMAAFLQEQQRVLQLAGRDVTQHASPTTPARVATPRATLKKKKPRTKRARVPVCSDNKQLVTMFVTGASRVAVDRAVGSLKTGFSDVCTNQTVQNECVSQLSDRQVRLLLKKAGDCDVEIEIEAALNRVIVRGEANDVTEMVGKIWGELNERQNQNRACEHAKLLARNVEWRYVLRGKTMRFSSKENAKIEEAHSSNALKVTVSIRGDQFMLNFVDNTGRGRMSGEAITINRKVLGTTEGLSLPSTWSTMPWDQHGMEVAVHTEQLDPRSPEYQDVVGKFQRSAPGTGVRRIDRIQNPHLYQVYQVRKQQMEKDIGANEMQLFHGTNSENVRKINTQGFNRSFSGLAHGTALGKGVYFAKDASHSMRFTSGGGAGGRFMYLARVLVGQYCPGHSSLIVPPPKNPSRPEILFESVVDNTGNPAVFVVFSDNQCYPEYLITF